MLRDSIGRLLIVLLLLFAAFSLSSCTIAKVSGRGPLPLLLNNLPSKIDVQSHFKESKMVVFDYTSSFDVSEIIADKLANSDAHAAVNITVTVRADVGTFIVNLFTLGLANARTIQVEGDLVKVSGGLGSMLQNSKVMAEVENLDEIKFYLKDFNEDIIVYPSILRIQDGYAIVEKFD